MLKDNSELVHMLRQLSIESDEKELFCDIFEEFIYELDCVDLSDITKNHLYNIFVKDMEFYFKSKNNYRGIII